MFGSFLRPPKRSSLVTASVEKRSARLMQRYEVGDFVDCYAAPSKVGPRVAIEEVVAFPAWVSPLLTARQIVTTPFGLSQGGPDCDDKVGAFPVVLETEDEILAGFDDKHLNFLVSVRTADDTVALTTWVRCHGLPGRAYLSLIMPFHILIARDAVERVALKHPL